jgi:GNAT superfamily N-acetyltransferase
MSHRLGNGRSAVFNHLTDEGSIPSSSTPPASRSLDSMTTPIIEAAVGLYTISTDPLRVDVDIVHRYLSNESYWAAGRSRDTVARSIANSALVAGAYEPGDTLVGFARMVTDRATFAWLCDVFVLDDHNGHGLGVALVRTLVEHPDVVGVKRQLLATGDAHGLYRRFGYNALDDPKRWMARPGDGR